MLEALGAIERRNNSAQFIGADRVLTFDEADYVAQYVNDKPNIAWIDIVDESGEGLITNEATSRAAMISELGEGRMVGFWSRGDDHKALCAAGGFAGIDWEQPNSARTLKFLTLPGRDPDSITLTEKEELDRKRLNYLSTWGELDFVAEGVALEGGVWAGTRIWLDWLVNVWQTELINTMVNRRSRLPKGPEGRAIIYQVSAAVLQRGVRNGGILRGGAVTEEIAANIRSIAGPGSVSVRNTLPSGWVLWLNPLYTPTDPRRQRGRVWIAGSESIHNVSIAGNLIEGANPISPVNAGVAA